MLAEQHLPGKSVGPTLDRILRDQFRRLRDGDFFYFEKDNWFSPQERNLIRNTSLSEIIERNTNLNQLQANVFFSEDCDGPSGPGGGNGPGGGGNGPGGGGGNGPGGGRSADFGLDFPDLESGLTVFPNPSKGEMTVTLNTPEATSANIKVLDVNGRVVFSQQRSGFDGSFRQDLDFGEMTPGIYFLQVVTDSGQFVRKLIVE